MKKINNKTILKIVHKLFKDKSYDRYLIAKIIKKHCNKHAQVIEKMINTGHYTKNGILKNIVMELCEQQGIIVSISFRKKRIMDKMFEAIEKDDILIVQGVPFKKIYQQYLREYDAIQKEKKIQKKESQSQKEISAFIPENINKFLIEQTSTKKNGKKNDRFEGGWISIFSRALTSLGVRPEESKTKLQNKYNKE